MGAEGWRLTADKYPSVVSATPGVLQTTTPRREHAQFCCPGRRVAWNQAHAGGRRVAAL